MVNFRNFTVNHKKTQSPNQRLGSNAVFAVSGKTDASTGEPESARKAAVRLRFDLQESAQYLMRKEKAGKRLLQCMVVPVPNPTKTYPSGVPMDAVIVEKDSKSEKTRYTNLAHCDSPWLCPVCSASASEKDKKEVNTAFAAATAKGFVAVMVTYTQRHDRASELKFLLEVNAGARRWMKSNSRIDGKTWGTLKEKYGMVGGIINLECTHGQNAWHPHNHELIFINPKSAIVQDTDEMYEDFSERWQYAVRQFGGDCDKEHGVDIKIGDAAVAEYIAKIGREPRGAWSIGAEMTKGNQKRGRKEGRTSQDLLFDYRFNDDEQAGALFVEFGREFAGKAHIRWSQGLRELLDMQSFEEQMSAEEEKRPDEEKPDFVPVCALPRLDWYSTVCEKTGRRVEFLFACGQGEIAITELLSRWNYKGIIHWIVPERK